MIWDAMNWVIFTAMFGKYPYKQLWYFKMKNYVAKLMDGFKFCKDDNLIFWSYWMLFFCFLFLFLMSLLFKVPTPYSSEKRPSRCFSEPQEAFYWRYQMQIWKLCCQKSPKGKGDITHEQGFIWKVIGPFCIPVFVGVYFVIFAFVYSLSNMLIRP